MRTVHGRRDRAGHATVALLAIGLLALAPGRSYKAQRFDADIQVLPGGDLRVQETVVFDFDGTYERVWRDLRTAKTDGIEILEATLDGRPAPRGNGPREITITGTSRIRVEWRFATTGTATHTFGLTYVAHGVARAVEGSDLVEWQALPTEHRYPIDASRVTFRAQESPADAPSLTSRGVDHASVVIDNGVITALANGIRPNGWISVRLSFPQGHVAPAQPQWERRRLAANEMGPRWVMYAAMVFAGGLVLLGLGRAGYRPAAPAPGESPESVPPDNLPPALVAVLLARGDTRGANGMATLLDLAERGVVSVRELPRRLGVRNFALAQVPGSHDLADHEQAAVRVSFADRPDEVLLSKARGRLARGTRRFHAAVASDLTTRGLLDPARKAVRGRLFVTAVTLLLVGVFGTIALAGLIPQYGPWPLLIGLGLGLSGVIGLIMAATTSALSDDGTREAARWRGFRRHLKTTATSRAADTPTAPSSWAVYAAAMGLGSHWAKYMKTHPGAVPPWFAALDASDASAAWVALVGSADTHGGAGGGSGSGAAGGGGSGAA